LLQTSNLLAEWVAHDLRDADVSSASTHTHMAAVFAAYAQRRFEARIYGVLKNTPDLHIYITNRQGMVVYDSQGRDVGADYARWRDVSRTLQGEYGARTTRRDAQDSTSSVMYVAAPIRQRGELMGVLSVGKPSQSLQGFIDAAHARAWASVLWLFGVALVLALAFSYWMTRDLRRLVAYADEVAAGQREHIPIAGRGELRRLATALERLRSELDGKAHIEKVTQLLAHELKSPIAALRGAAELLSDETDATRRARLEANIDTESRRLQRIVEGVLDLARAENRGQLDHAEPVAFDEVVREVLESRHERLSAKSLTLDTQLPPTRVMGNRFLLRQAVGNLLDNAVDFSPTAGRLTLHLHHEGTHVRLDVRDQGPGIADYALPRLFERFYSTPRPDTGERGTGLGLNLVQEVARLHHGHITLSNHPDGGAQALLTLALT
ncbi:MAG: hypothetical protein RLZZ612_997, partial [Pseudomonadota bacterium]